MKLTQFQFDALCSLRVSATELGNSFDVVWNSLQTDAGWRDRYGQVMDIKSPLIDRVRAHLVTCTLTGQTE